MTGLDTNVLVRYVVQDDPAQSATATRLIENFTAAEPGFVSMIVVVETVWVLQSNYKAERREIARVLEALLRSRELVVEHAELVWQALRIFAQSGADFADCLTERSGHAAGCDETVTFDQRASRTAGMKFLG
ncbi:MAG TPA: type II toxin-antitoxin system VapC family toxin [Terriglobales bacterium]|jgi:predicted nucleic-acid-binding protein